MFKLSLDEFGEAVGGVPEGREAFFQMADGRNVGAAKTFFKFGNTLPGMTERSVGGSDTAEIVESAAAFDGILDGSPLQSIGGHQVAVFVAGGAVKIGGHFAEKSDNNAGNYFVFVISVVNEYIVGGAEGMDNIFVVLEGMRAETISVACF